MKQSPPEIARRELLGVPIALVDYERAMDTMDAIVDGGAHGYVCAIAVHALMASRHDPELHAALEQASLVVPDGRPLVWALNALGERLPDRVYGPELMARYCARAVQRAHRVWLYGGATPAALDALERTLHERFPGIVIAGRHSPPHRPLRSDEEEEIAARIDGDRADVVFVGLGAPKQEKWMARMRDRLDVPVMVGVGAAFDFHAGRVSMAPVWMQERGLEWIYRTSQEPRRLLGRYLSTNPRFVAAFAHQYLRERRRR